MKERSYLLIASSVVSLKRIGSTNKDKDNHFEDFNYLQNTFLFLQHL